MHGPTALKCVPSQQFITQNFPPRSSCLAHFETGPQRENVFRVYGLASINSRRQQQKRQKPSRTSGGVEGVCTGERHGDSKQKTRAVLYGLIVQQPNPCHERGGGVHCDIEIAL